MPLFGKSPKSPADLSKTALDSLVIITKGHESKRTEKAVEDVAKSLTGMKNILYGTGDQEPSAELIGQLAQCFYNDNLFELLVTNIKYLDFETRKDVAQIFNNLLRRQIGSRSPTVDYVQNKKNVLFILCSGYENQQIALNCGIMLRDAIRYEPLAKLIMENPLFYSFFDYVEMSTFDIASDAFATFKELLTRHKMLSAKHLEENYDKIFEKYRKLLDSDNYVTKRQSLKLLGELLLDRHNFTVMTKYISNPDNLKLMMNMLRDPSRNIQFEAFHVFKVFVANPNKTPAILSILIKNKHKLVDFLTSFHSDRTEDEQFNDEKTYLIKQIRDLPSPEPAAS